MFDSNVLINNERIVSYLWRNTSRIFHGEGRGRSRGRSQGWPTGRTPPAWGPTRRGDRGKNGGEAGSRQLRVPSFCEYERVTGKGVPVPIGGSFSYAVTDGDVARRCKQAGMHWRIHNAAKIAALISKYRSEAWKPGNSSTN